MPSGTLHQYFKQPPQKECKTPVATSSKVAADDGAASTISSNILKRKGIVSTDDGTKRRKLSLSNLRAKQSNLPPVLPANIASAVVTCSSEHKIIIETNSVKFKSDSYNSNLSDKDKYLMTSDNLSPSKTMEVSNSKDTSDDGLLSLKVQDELKISSPVREAYSPIKLKKTPKRGKRILSDSDDEISEYTEKQENCSGTEADIEPCQDKSNQSEVKQIFSRRSSRTRKPIKRYTIDCSEDESW